MPFFYLNGASSLKMERCYLLVIFTALHKIAKKIIFLVKFILFLVSFTFVPALLKHATESAVFHTEDTIAFDTADRIISLATAERFCFLFSMVSLHLATLKLYVLAVRFFSIFFWQFR